MTILRGDRRLGLGYAAATPIGALAGFNLASRRKFRARGLDVGNHSVVGIDQLVGADRPNAKSQKLAYL